MTLSYHVSSLDPVSYTHLADISTCLKLNNFIRARIGIINTEYCHIAALVDVIAYVLY